MYTIHNFQEGVQQSSGMGGYVWIALIIFFLMVFLGWLVSSKGWLKKEAAPAAVDHGHDSHDQGAHETHEAPAETHHLESAHGASVSTDAVSHQVEPAPAAKQAGPDDLTILEGVGPKVAKVLAGIGITTFAGLATADFASVRSALDAAGYKYMEPAGWIEQAALAAKGDMDGLKKLQGELKGGRRAS